ncbi:acyltransferase [Shewanella sp. AS1]|uniref:MBOAT family O-acyltransferase n=1 Tax=Shewanella sp. AS1 TaxID=2907626 RepID=UPI001F175DCF|nr:MBOAT family O-acyltransferase [Shewanella sp. AS1]MCE9678640.1 acyltransferase [Shewanella sp. AS1]
MAKSITLSAYVKKRNGVALGAPESMRNMLSRSLGAGSFHQFWEYWNPIWGYYLARLVMRPCLRVLPFSLALIMTFAVSGALHDLAVTLVKVRVTLFFTPWFTLMGLCVLASKRLPLSYGRRPWLMRAMINLSIICACLLLTQMLLK